MIKLSMLSEATVNCLAKVFGSRPIPVTFSEEQFLRLPKTAQIMIVGDITDSELLTTFSDKRFPRHVRLRLASSHYCPQPVLHNFLKEGDIQLILNVAGNLSTNSSDLKELSQYGDRRTRARVAYNANTPNTVLRVLSMDYDVLVRQCVSNNPHVPEDVLIYLARDRSALVRQGIATQAELPYKVSQILLQDKNTSVLFALARNKTMEKAEIVLTELAKCGVTIVQKAVAHNPKVTAETLDYLSQNGDDEVKISVSEVRNS